MFSSSKIISTAKPFSYALLTAPGPDTSSWDPGPWLYNGTSFNNAPVFEFIHSYLYHTTFQDQVGIGNYLFRSNNKWCIGNELSWEKKVFYHDGGTNQAPPTNTGWQRIYPSANSSPPSIVPVDGMRFSTNEALIYATPGPREVSLKWKIDTNTNVIGYRIFWTLRSEFGQQVHNFMEVSGRTTNFALVTNLSSQEQYLFQVSSIVDLTQFEPGPLQVHGYTPLITPLPTM